MSKKQISDQEGLEAIKNYVNGDQTRSNLFVAVRYSLQEISRLYPGKSVEIRIPPVAATQILEGNSHTRGTPPAVVECSVTTWLDLCLGLDTWENLKKIQKIQAHGERSDLSNIMPLFAEIDPK